MNERIFISYKRADKERVFVIKDSIEQATGERCWIDLDGIESDAQFVEVIMNAIDDCEVFLFMRSAEHNKITNHRTDWTIREVNYALGERKRIVFVALDNSPLPRWFKFMFPNQQEIDSSDSIKLKKFYDDLIYWLNIDTTKLEATECDYIINEEIITVNGVSFVMKQIQGGAFTMGATIEQKNDADEWELPSHIVSLSDFMLGEIPVTQELWQAVMESNPSFFYGLQNPVENVSWDDCQIFIAKLNQITGKKFRLPTEAEWEFAARGGNKSKGYKFAGSNILSSVAWYEENSDATTHPVKQKIPNELGLYDMNGNVQEWCWDKFKLYNDIMHEEMIGAFAKSYALRGGSWSADVRECRVSSRFFWDSIRLDTVGLRLAL